MTNERMFINFDNFLGIKYIRKVESIYMSPNDFDSMKSNFENIFQENTKLKAEIEQLKELIPKICETCKYEDLCGTDEPCDGCKNSKNWILKAAQP